MIFKIEKHEIKHFQEVHAIRTAQCRLTQISVQDDAFARYSLKIFYFYIVLNILPFYCLSQKYGHFWYERLISKF